MTSQSDTSVATPIRTDVLIIGAGPVGLFAAFEAGVVGLSCQIVDTLERIGGQCIELYPDKPIYDIPAIASCTARELVDRLMEQCRPFDVPIHLSQRVETVQQR
jgi:thioredoxin reductase (NADPH)